MFKKMNAELAWSARRGFHLDLTHDTVHFVTLGHPPLQREDLL